MPVVDLKKIYIKRFLKIADIWALYDVLHCWEHHLSCSKLEGDLVHMQKAALQKEFNETGKITHTFFPHGVIVMWVKKHSLFHWLGYDVETLFC